MSSGGRWRGGFVAAGGGVKGYYVGDDAASVGGKAEGAWSV